MQITGLRGPAIADDGRQLKLTFETNSGPLELEASDMLLEVLVGQLAIAVKAAAEKRYGVKPLNLRMAEFALNRIPRSGTVGLALKAPHEPLHYFLLPDERARDLGDQLVKAANAQVPNGPDPAPTNFSVHPALRR